MLIMENYIFDYKEENKMKYVVEIEVKGLNMEKRRNRELGQKLEKEFVTLYDEAVNEINPNLSDWNYKFEKFYGEIENAGDLSVYNHYMAVKTNRILKKYDNRFKGLKLRANKDCEIEGLYAFRGTTAIVSIGDIKEA